MDGNINKKKKVEKETKKRPPDGQTSTKIETETKKHTYVRKKI